MDDKSHQVLTFFQEASQSTTGLAFIFDRKTNQLKGFKEESLICRSRDFNSIDWVFDSRSLGPSCLFLRTDAHMLFILKKIRLMAVTRRDDDVLKILNTP